MRLLPLAEIALSGCLAIGWLPSISAAQVCAGDCGRDGTVTVDEVVTTLGIALGDVAADACIASDSSCDGEVTVDEVVASVVSALEGCGDAFAVRGDLIVAASPAVGFLRQIPDGPALGGTPLMPAQYGVGNPDEVQVRVVATGLVVPWALAFAPDGRLFVTERPGRVRVIADGSLNATPWAVIDVTQTSEGGLMGLALHPDFTNQPWVYVCYTARSGSDTINRISRLIETDGVGGTEEILIDDIPGASVHDGCRLKFGADGMLYATTGDAQQRALAQDLSSLRGKVLRMRPDGSIPADNPFGPDSYVYSYGHRNPQGLAFRKRDGALFETEHGPSGEVGGLRAHDEVNQIVAGKNYGWPLAVGAPRLPEYRDPILLFPTTAVPPAGATFYEASAIPSWTGNLFFTSLGARHLQRVVLDQCDRPYATERLFVGEYGRLRDAIEGPDGSLYVSTSNRDGRAQPADDDDRILQIAPASPEAAL